MKLSVMRRIFIILAAIAFLLPVGLSQAPLHAQSRPVNTSASPERQRPDPGFGGPATPPFRALQDAWRLEVLAQVSITQRVIVRVSPSTPDARARMLANLPRRPAQSVFEEVPHEDCVEIEDIAGVTSTQDNRLLLFMRNRDVLAAQLERGCTARAFYSGFYVERSEDGRLCIARDELQSRAGASCMIEGLTELVAIGN